MSQIHYKHKYKHKSFKVLTGWDNSLDHHFLLIEDHESDEKGPIFDNLTLPNFRMSVPQIAETLKEFDIPFPDRIRMRLTEHREMDAGNLVETFRQCPKCHDYFESDENCSCY